MTSATDALRALLTERGVKWEETTNDVRCVFTWWESPTFGKVHAMDNEDGTLFMACLNNCDFTPEQAVEATLGRGVCHDMYTDDDEWFACSECNTELRVHEPFGVICSIHYCPNCGRKVVD